MGIITISNLSYSQGTEVAQALGKRLGYEYYSRNNLRTDASDRFNLPEIKTARATERPPSLLDRITGGKQKYVAHIRSVLFKRLKDDNIVYHGFVGQFLVKDIPNTLKVLITSDIKDRVRTLVDSENIKTEKAEKYLEKIDTARGMWSRHLYGVDTWDLNHYDAVFRIDNMTVENVVDSIANLANLPCFQFSSMSKSIIDDLALSADVEANLIGKFPGITFDVTKDGKVSATLETNLNKQAQDSAELNRILEQIDGIKDVEIHFKFIPDSIYADR